MLVRNSVPGTIITDLTPQSDCPTSKNSGPGKRKCLFPDAGFRQMLLKPGIDGSFLCCRMVCRIQLRQLSAKS